MGNQVKLFILSVSMTTGLSPLFVFKCEDTKCFLNMFKHNFFCSVKVFQRYGWLAFWHIDEAKLQPKQKHTDIFLGVVAPYTLC